MNTIRMAAVRPLEKAPDTMKFFTAEAAREVMAYHASFKDYAETPLRALRTLAGEAGVKGLFVKDESWRFGLNAFKALGGSYAIGRYLAGRLGISPSEMTYDLLTSPENRARIGEVTFATATDGNHGRGVAWTSRMLGQKCRVYMPKGSVSERVSNIRAQGAEVIVTDVNYDDTVRLVNALAQKNGWIVVQDTAWAGYEEIPPAHHAGLYDHGA